MFCYRVVWLLLFFNKCGDSPPRAIYPSTFKEASSPVFSPRTQSFTQARSHPRPVLYLVLMDTYSPLDRDISEGNRRWANPHMEMFWIFRFFPGHAKITNVFFVVVLPCPKWSREDCAHIWKDEFRIHFFWKHFSEIVMLFGPFWRVRASRDT